jgi:hypothetical protein
MIITISDMWKNQQKMLDNDNQIKLSSLIVILDDGGGSLVVCKECASGGNQGCCGLFGLLCGSPVEERLRAKMRTYTDPNSAYNIHKRERSTFYAAHHDSFQRTGQAVASIAGSSVQQGVASTQFQFQATVAQNRLAPF